jgi:hypothetical protein
MTLSNLTYTAAIAAAVALSIGVAPAASADSGPEVAMLHSLGLSTYTLNGVIAAEGPAPAVAQVCTALGTKAGYGAIAAYTGTDETGTGLIIFAGDNVPAGSVYGTEGMTEVNFQNCTDQPWEIGEPGRAPVDVQAPGTDGSTPPQDWAVQEGRSRVLGTP